MKKLFYLFLFIGFNYSLYAQHLYVDPSKGSDLNNGNISNPFRTIKKAIESIDQSENNGQVTIELFPGYYYLSDTLFVKTKRSFDFKNRLTIKALYMPGDSAWTPKKTPVLQSTSSNNSNLYFPHCVGLQIGMSHVSIKGLKFIGNPNPEVVYYYPISREYHSLIDLQISQCYFIGEKFGAPIQGAIYTGGLDLNVDHCIFYNCKNAFLNFAFQDEIKTTENTKGSSLTYSIIYGAYEGAIWTGDPMQDFIFSNNIISNCKRFWVKFDTDSAKYELKNSVITNCQDYICIQSISRSFKGKKAIDDNNVIESKVIRSGEIDIVEFYDKSVQKDYLNLRKNSIGYELNAGVFKK